MKKLFLSFIFALSALASQPDNITTYIFSNRPGIVANGTTIFAAPGAGTPFNNLQRGCVTWQLSYTAEGFTALNITLQQSGIGIQNNSPVVNTTWGVFNGSNQASTSIPMTNTAQDFYTARAFYPFVRVNLASATGTGTIVATLSCWSNINYAQEPREFDFSFRPAYQTSSKKVSLP